MKLSDIASKIGGTLENAVDSEIHGVAGIPEAGRGEIAFISNPKYNALAEDSRASALVVPGDWKGETASALLRVKNPDSAFAQIAELFYVPPPVPPKGVHPSAVVADDVELGPGVSVGPLCVVETGAELGARTVLVANCYVGSGVSIGEDSKLYPMVSVRESCVIGSRVLIHNSTVIGSDGFGYSVDDQGVRSKIPQIGIVEIGDDVEIGANTAIDRARFGKTKIGNGVKIDNLVQIAHNVVIGDHAVIVAQVGISGSTSVGEKAILAGQVGVAGHLTIGAGAIIGAQAGVSKDVPPKAHMLGAPAMPIMRMKKMHAGVLLLPRLKERIERLEKRINQLVDQKK